MSSRLRQGVTYGFDEEPHWGNKLAYEEVCLIGDFTIPSLGLCILASQQCSRSAK